MDYVFATKLRMVTQCFPIAWSKKIITIKTAFITITLKILGEEFYLLTYLSQLPQAWPPLLRPSPWPLTYLTHEPTLKISHFHIT